MNIYERIRRLCEVYNTNIFKLEKECGFSVGAIKKWENHSPKAENIEKVADYFEVSVDFLLGRTTIPGFEDVNPDSLFFFEYGRELYKKRENYEEYIKKNIVHINCLNEEERQQVRDFVEFLRNKKK